ncbi:hypothetical protein [Sphingomonas sp. So64.6b]|uniref:hypothetical protein n=1 Tax=Sphingomonas sp. So64.6b TaxID=2997354 RepID=UPI0019226E28|nr:hypothetical protein [Sphingomonas sp. So64.6b]
MSVAAKATPDMAVCQIAIPAFDARNQGIASIRSQTHYPRAHSVAEEIGQIANLKMIDHSIREAGIRVFCAPHRRWEPGDYEDWCHPNPPSSPSCTAITSHVANGAVHGIPTLFRSPAISSPKNTGGRAVSPMATNDIKPQAPMFRRLRSHHVSR